MSKQHISIGPDFFRKAKNDYANWKWAIIREFMQNSIDADSKNVRFGVSSDGTTTTLVCEDDGCGMTKDVLVDKLLSLGSSGKDFDGVGGFGKAKEILYFCHDRYTIETRGLKVSGVGAEYELTKLKKSRVGTKSTIVMQGDLVAELEANIALFVGLSNCSCKFWYNGQLQEGGMRKGYYRRDLPFGKVYTNRQAQNLVVVRIGGMPMFTMWTKHDGCVVVELDGTSGDVLIASRDRLQYKQGALLEGFLQDLTTNKRKALKQIVTEYIRYDGHQVAVNGNAGFDKFAKAGRKLKDAVASVESDGSPAPTQSLANGSTYNSEDRVVDNEQHAAHAIASRFIIKNETGRKVRPKFMPDDERFSPYAYKSIMMWTNILRKLHQVFDVTDAFTVGFVFSDECIAQHEYSSEYGRVYYVNPLDTDGTQRFNPSQPFSRWAMVSYALHEFVHGLGYSDHDEDYAARLTHMSGVVMRYASEFKKCFKV